MKGCRIVSSLIHAIADLINLNPSLGCHAVGVDSEGRRILLMMKAWGRHGEGLRAL
jgi:hypothetical protein